MWILPIFDENKIFICKKSSDNSIDNIVQLKLRKTQKFK